jgi:sulfur-oxidizing protein SoxY
VPATTRKIDPLRRIILKSASASGAIGVLLASGLLRPTGVLAADWNRPAFTATSLPDAIKASGLTGSVESSGIVIKTVDIAENGAQVPLEVVSNIAGSQTIAVFVDKNPLPLGRQSELRERGPGARPPATEDGRVVAHTHRGQSR